MLNTVFIIYVILFLQIEFSNCTKWHGENVTSDSSIEARKKEEKGMMNKMMPMMIIPFMISTAIIPIMLVTIKFMLLKTAFIGKLAVIVMLLNMLRSRTAGLGGVFNHNVQVSDMSMAHYGYSGEEEYGAYVNK